MKTKILSWAVVVMLLSACSSRDYTCALPSGAVALMAIDARQLADGDDTGNQLVTRLSGTANLADCGLDFARPVFAFETSDGLFGLLAKVGSAERVGEWLRSLGAQLSEKHGCRFGVVHNNFVVGCSDDALLVVGPVIDSEMAGVRRRMAKMLGADEIPESPLYDKLLTLDGPVKLVARTSVLPRKYAIPLLLGTPKGTSAEDVLLAATLTIHDGRIEAEGETFSFRPAIDSALKKSLSCLRPVESATQMFPDDAMLGIYVNVEGDRFLDLLRSDDDLRLMLAGANTQAETDSLICHIDGDAAFMISADKEFQVIDGPVGGTGTSLFVGDSRLYMVLNLQAFGIDFVNSLVGDMKYVTYRMK